MKKGRIAVLDSVNGQRLAALMVNGRLFDLVVDPRDDDRPRPEAIYRAVAGLPMKGQNGIVLDLGQGQKGFLKQARGISPGTVMLVQINTHGEGQKAAPVSSRLIFKSRYAIVTPDAPGLNIARKIRDQDERERLLEIAHEGLEGAGENLGLILRSACEGAPAEVIFDDIQTMRSLCEDILAEAGGSAPKLLCPAPDAHTRAWRDWSDPDPDEVVDTPDSFETLGIWDHIEALKSPVVTMASASMIVEPTSALVAVDVNTGGDFSLTAGLKANLAVARELPRQLRLRGLGGQIVVDYAPMGKKDRRQLEAAMRTAFRQDSTDTILVGWTPLGHFELQRKRERLPLRVALGS